MDEKMKKIQKLLDAAEADLHTARSLMREYLDLNDSEPLDTKGKAKDLSVLEEGKVVEGVFNGQNMIGADSKEYTVPANYASKSKLVEGDTLKLTIGDDGSFMYKQIAPIERRKLIGTLSQSDGNYMVTADGKNYKVLQASITYYKGMPGDQITIILPKEHESSWAAVENVIKKNIIDGDNSSPSEPAPASEDQNSETKEAEPDIEYPSTDDSQDVKEEKKSPLIKNPDIAEDVPKDDNQGVDQGIKELEI
jgi:hypothetical protein